MDTVTTDDNHRRRALLAIIARRNLHLEQHATYVRVHGCGIDIVCRHLELITPGELEPRRYLSRD